MALVSFLLSVSAFEFCLRPPLGNSPSSGAGYVCELEKSGDGDEENVGPDPDSAPWLERSGSILGGRRQP